MPGHGASHRETLALVALSGRSRCARTGRSVSPSPARLTRGRTSVSAVTAAMGTNLLLKVADATAFENGLHGNCFSRPTTRDGAGQAIPRRPDRALQGDRRCRGLRLGERLDDPVACTPAAANPARTARNRLNFGEQSGNGSGYLSVASKDGVPNPPAWYLNLEAQPGRRDPSCRTHEVRRPRQNRRPERVKPEPMGPHGRGLAGLASTIRRKTDRDIPASRPGPRLIDLQVFGRTPGRTRTDTETLLRGLPLPLGYGGGRCGCGRVHSGPSPTNPASSAARARTASSIGSVRRPVKVFCWLT